jgi:hypothetical protein
MKVGGVNSLMDDSNRDQISLLSLLRFDAPAEED